MFKNCIKTKDKSDPIWELLCWQEVNMINYLNKVL